MIKFFQKNDDVSGLRSCLSVLEKQGKGYCPIVYRLKNSLQETLGFCGPSLYPEGVSFLSD